MPYTTRATVANSENWGLRAYHENQHTSEYIKFHVAKGFILAKINYTNLGMQPREYLDDFSWSDIASIIQNTPSLQLAYIYPRFHISHLVNQL